MTTKVEQRCVIAITPSSRSCLGVYGSVTAIELGDHGVHCIHVPELYLTPDWRDEVKVALMFGPEFEMSDALGPLIREGARHGVILKDGKCAAFDSHYHRVIFASKFYGSAKYVTGRLTAKGVSEVVSSPVILREKLHVSMVSDLAYYITEDTEQWPNIMHSETRKKTLTSKTWQTTSTMLQKMLSR